MGSEDWKVKGGISEKGRLCFLYWSVVFALSAFLTKAPTGKPSSRSSFAAGYPVFPLAPVINIFGFCMLSSIRCIYNNLVKKILTSESRD